MYWLTSLQLPHVVSYILLKTAGLDCTAATIKVCSASNEWRLEVGVCDQRYGWPTDELLNLQLIILCSSASQPEFQRRTEVANCSLDRKSAKRPFL